MPLHSSLGNRSEILSQKKKLNKYISRHGSTQDTMTLCSIGCQLHAPDCSSLSSIKRDSIQCFRGTCSQDLLKAVSQEEERERENSVLNKGSLI